MKPKLLLVFVLIIGLLLILSACSPSAAPASSGSTNQVSSSDGKALVESRCTVCHGMDRISSATKTESEWTQTVDRMIGHGAVLNDSEKAAVIAYLAATYK